MGPFKGFDFKDYTSLRLFLTQLEFTQENTYPQKTRAVATDI